MKRWLILTAALLLLTGCGAKPETAVATESFQAEVQSPTEPTGYYDPNSELEASTDGAARVYPLNRTDSCGLVSIGNDLLLLSGSEVTTLTRLTGSTLYVSAAANLDCYVDVNSPAFQASEKGVTYYDALHRQLVFLDSSLKEVTRVTLPETILGDPALSADRKQLYYFTAEHLRCLDLETGLDRMVKEVFFPQQSIDGLLFNDTVVECSVTDSDGNRYGLYISAQTGETLWEAHGDNLELTSSGQSYFAVHQDGAYRELLTGTTEQEPMLLTPAEYGADFTPIPTTGGAVLTAVTEDTVTLSYYDLETGTRPYALSLPGADFAPHSILGDPDRYCIWFLGYDEAYCSDILCRWELAKTPTGDETVYTSSRYTYENPDTDGIAACKEQAAAIGKKYGVEILLWTDAVSCQPDGYWMSAEYQVPLLAQSLRKLDEALSLYPSGFLKKAASGSTSGKVKLCLVRSITGNADANALERTSGLQFWDRKGNAYVAVTADEDLERTLFRELFHVIDSRVLSTCSIYDSWSSLNPDGFEYSYDYTTQPEENESLPEGDTGAFIDTFSMISPREDRARIMEAAMSSGNEDCFESAAMQRKLRQLCLGIRKAFELESSTESFLWEQYLKESLSK